jgi:hypothetical protein
MTATIGLTSSIRCLAPAPSRGGELSKNTASETPPPIEHAHASAGTLLNRRAAAAR